MSSLTLLVCVFAFLAPSVAAQLSGSVGPLTSFGSKASKQTCNVLDYGAKADKSTDLGPPLLEAWDDCKSGGLVYIPPGNYAMATWVIFDGGSKSAIQLDGIIYRDSDDGGHMIIVSDSSDFKLFSGTSKGAFQGFGYKLLSQDEYGPRFLRLESVENFSLHGIAFVDPASYFIVVDECINGEMYKSVPISLRHF
jgi:rhamnogalacturonan hydrolase